MKDMKDKFLVNIFKARYAKKNTLYRNCFKKFANKLLKTSNSIASYFSPIFYTKYFLPKPEYITSCNK